MEGPVRRITDLVAWSNLDRGKLCFYPLARGAFGVLSDVFVGRETELARLGEALEAALQGHGRIVTLAGEPGIGKTRTARELAGRAAARGAAVHWARCQEEGGAPPFCRWVQLIRAYARAANPSDLRCDLGPGAPDITEVVPDLRAIFPDLESPPSLELDRARFRFFDSVAAFLKRASARRPLVLILDNLHWADRPSLLLLEFLTSELAASRLFILGTYRDSEIALRHPLARTLSELAKEQHFDQILLRGLTPPQVSTYLADQTGVVPPHSLVDAIWQHTEGNPLFLTQLARLLEQDGVFAPDRLGGSGMGLEMRIPDGVRDVIGRRLDRLPADCQRVLRVGSVIGREFGLRLLERLLPDLERGQIQDAVEAAVGPGLVEGVPSAPARYRFTHVLVQRTLSDQLTTSERLVLHGRIADELEQVYGEEVELHAGELAYHLGEAVEIDAARLVRYSRIAGEQALRVHGYEEAVFHFQRALTAKPTGPVDGETAAILFGLGRAQAATLPLARMHEAVASLRRAGEYYVATRDVARAIDVALLPYYPTTAEPTGQTQLLLQALSLVPDGSKEAALLLARSGLLLAREEADFAAARTAWQRALAIAEKSDDPALAFRVLADAAHADLMDNPSPEWLPMIARALEARAEGRDPQVELMARYNAVQVSFVFADPDGITRFSDPMLPLAERLRDRVWLSTAHRVRAYVPWLRGEYAAARAESDLSLAVAPEEPRNLAIRIQIEYETGNFGAGERYLDRLIRLMEARPTVANPTLSMTSLMIPIVARLTSSPEQLPRAQRAADVVLAKWAGRWGARVAYTARAFIAIIQNDRQAARDAYRALVADQHPLSVNCTTCRDRLLGLLARTMGDDARARQHFADALAFCEQRDLRPELAWTAYDFADFLFSSSRSEDRARSGDLLNEALALSRQLGMRPLEERALALAQRIASDRATRPTYPDGLTEREVEVMRLLAAGKTDRVIAGELTLSIRTVSSHVSSILMKTATANRTGAATYALRHGIV